MKYIMRWILVLIPKEPPKPTGRWGITYCDKKLNKRIDLSNEDHCGPCGQYILQKEIEKTFDVERDNKRDIKTPTYKYKSKNGVV